LGGERERRRGRPEVGSGGKECWHSPSRRPLRRNALPHDEEGASVPGIKGGWEAMRFDPRVTVGQQINTPLDPFSFWVDPLRTVAQFEERSDFERGSIRTLRRTTVNYKIVINSPEVCFGTKRQCAMVGCKNLIIFS
jgi:hypothetical protein